MILKLDQVAKLLSLSQRTIIRMVAKGCFPQPVGLGVGRYRWRESDVRHFVESLDTQGQETADEMTHAVQGKCEVDNNV